MFKFVRDVCLLVQGRNYLGDEMHVDEAFSDDKKRRGRFARGSINLQNGNYLSIAEMERKREALARHSFPAP